MEEFSIIAYQIGTFFIFTAIGWFLKQFNIVKEEGFKGLSDLLIKIIMPLMIFTSIVNGNTRKSITDNLFFLILCVIYYAVLIIIGILIPKVLKLDKEHDGLFRTAFSFGNAGGIGLFLVTDLYPDVGIIFFALYLLIDTPIFWVYGISMTRKPEDRWSGKWYENLKKIISPALVVTFLGVFLVVAEIPIPDIVLDITSTIGSAAKPLGLMAVGSMFAVKGLLKFLKKPDIYVYVAVKMIVLPIVIYLVLKLVGVPDEAAKTLLIFCALPSNTSGMILSSQHGTDSEYLVNIGAVTTILCFVTYPIIFYLIALIGI